MTRSHARMALLVALAVVIGLVAWTYFRTRRRVLDAGNSEYASGLFDALNPSLATGPTVGT